MTKKEYLEKLYIVCEKINHDELDYLLCNANSEEEKEFYVMISDYFIQQRQIEIAVKDSIYKR